MVTATETIATFQGEMARDVIAGYVNRLIASGIEKDEAIIQTVDAIIQARRSDAFLRAFGVTIIKDMLNSLQTRKHPARRLPIDYDIDAPIPDRDGWGGQAGTDTQPLLAAPPSPDPIPQTFPEPGTGRVLNLTRLRDPRPLTGVLSGTWSVDGHDVPLGLLTAEQCFMLAQKEARIGRTHATNGTMFRRLGESLSPGEVVADRWDEAGVMKQFELAEPKL